MSLRFLYFILLVIFSCSENNSVSSGLYKNDINGKWLLDNSSVFDSVLIFRKQTLADSNLFWAKQFEFTDTSISYEAINKVVRCGNGIFSLDSTNLNKDSNKLTLSLFGGYSLRSDFQYISKYRIEGKSESSFKLVKIIEIRDTSFHPWNR